MKSQSSGGSDVSESVDLESSVHDNPLGLVSSVLEVDSPGGSSSSPGGTGLLHQSHGQQSPSGDELLTLLESEGDSLHDSLDSLSSSDGTLDDTTATSSVVLLGRSSLVKTGSAAPAPSGAVGTGDSASGTLEFTTASAILAHSKLAPLGKFLALTDDLSLNNLDLLDGLLGSTSSSVEELLGSLLVESRGTAPAPFRAELFGWATALVLGTASSFFGNGVFAARVS